MSVLIKGMDMPKDCFECVFFDEEHNWCDMQDEHLHNQKDKTGRAKWCPFVEVPTPHGRLIDVDKIESYMLPTEKQDKKTWFVHSAEYKNAVPHFNHALQLVRDNAPTVIEAEE